MTTVVDADGTVHDIRAMSDPIGSARCGNPPMREATGQPWLMSDLIGRLGLPGEETTCPYCLAARP